MGTPNWLGDEPDIFTDEGGWDDEDADSGDIFAPSRRRMTTR